MNSFDWYVVQTKPGQTLKAKAELENQEFDIFCPMINVEKLKQGKRSTLSEPMFPGYLFIYLSEMASNWRPIRSTRGVSRLISFGNTPARVPKPVLQQLRDQLRASQPDTALYTKDQPISINEGPFVGLNAIFSEFNGEKRAFLLLDLLGRWQKIDISLASIAPKTPTP